MLAGLPSRAARCRQDLRGRPSAATSRPIEPGRSREAAAWPPAEAGALRARLRRLRERSGVQPPVRGSGGSGTP